MSAKTSKIKFFIINGSPVIAPRDFTAKRAAKWYQRAEKDEASDVRIGSLTDRREIGTRETWGDIIEQAEFETADLPMIL